MTVCNAIQERLKHNRTSTELQEQYRREQNRVKSLIHNDKREYYVSKFENCKGTVCNHAISKEHCALQKDHQ